MEQNITNSVNKGQLLEAQFQYLLVLHLQILNFASDVRK